MKREWTTSRRPVPRLAGERGIIIVLALLVLLALAAVAVLAAHRVSVEIDRGGNYRRATEGSAMTWIGALTSLSVLQNKGSVVVNAMRTRGEENESWNLEDFDGGNVLDLEDHGSFGKQVAPHEALFQSRVSVIGEKDGVVAGFSAGEYTFALVALTTSGNFGDTALGDASSGEVVDVRSAQNRVRVFMLVGPLPHIGSGGGG